jgi:hypothetical protein
MTTELVLLLALFAFITGGAFFGEKGPIQVFAKSGPRLAARVERQVTIGRGFKLKDGSTPEWLAPDTPPPRGQL